MEDHRAGSFVYFAFEGERKSIRDLSLRHGIKSSVLKLGGLTEDRRAPMRARVRMPESAAGNIGVYTPTFPFLTGFASLRIGSVIKNHRESSIGAECLGFYHL